MSGVASPPAPAAKATASAASSESYRAPLRRASRVPGTHTEPLPWPIAASEASSVRWPHGGRPQKSLYFSNICFFPATQWFVLMYFLAEAFASFEPEIRAVFGRAVSDAGLDILSTPLIITDKPHRLDHYEAEFAAIAPPGRVQITWNGIASLWACAQGLARLTRRMFEAQRAGMERLYLDKDSGLEKGLYCYELARRLSKHRFDRWVDWFPTPDFTSTQEDDRLGNALFFAALGWILRHELAHIGLKHHAGILANSITRYDAEIEADVQASKWTKGALAADHSRPARQKPSPDELESGVGLLWVGLFEEAFHSPSPEYPAIAERIFASFDLFDLAEDSFAAEIFSYSVKAWIDPQADWGVPTNNRDGTARAAFIAAVVRLHRHMTDL
jgi:hypothetical protein